MKEIEPFEGSKVISYGANHNVASTDAEDNVEVEDKVDGELQFIFLSRKREEDETFDRQNILTMRGMPNTFQSPLKRSKCQASDGIT